MRKKRVSTTILARITVCIWIPTPGIEKLTHGFTKKYAMTERMKKKIILLAFFA
jgi:hypothetical protein